ncbi:MAG: endolytic transglycosylase MltG, partial [Ghiorsea sp.]
MFKPRLLHLLITSCVLLLALSWYVWWQAHAAQNIAKHAVMIAKGSSSSAIALHLEKEHIIDSALIFRWWTRLSGDAASLKPGLYHFSGQLSMLDVLQILKKGEVQQFKVTIPEGLRTDEMLVLLAKRSHTNLKRWQEAQQNITQDDAFEGVFLPETYLYSKPIDPEAILRQMYEARAQVEAELAQTFAWSKEQVIRNRIMASIVEKETALPHERVWVSAAIHNRIRLHMPLQMDPTVIYGMVQSQ